MAQFGGDASMPIAVIGMGCRFPGDATSPDRLWELLVNGRNAWSEFPKDRINIDGFYHPSGDRQGSICFKGGHFLKDDVAAWDAPFFSTTAHEAAAMDPQQRILLEVSYEAFENAGIPMETLPGSATAVYCGSFVKDYEQIVLRDPDDSPQYAATGNGIAIMSNRISWFYDLKGPSMTLDTGCSASLVGVHLACQSLRTGESTMAMAMGAGLILTPATMMPMTALNFLSPDGKCFTFDERANGYGRGEGIGAVVLKPLEAALRDNDTIRAVIRGSGVNQDGRTPGITMPSKDAQAMNIRAVYKAAGLGYDRTAYFEAHGTGTQAGDPTELGAISGTFAETRNSEDPIFVGSVKTNIGHLEGCAGIAGLIKGILILENGLIPPNLYFEKVNPKIDLIGWKIKVPTSVTAWPMEGLRRVSINCFGFGGTNAHIILDDALHYLSEHSLDGQHCSIDVSPSPTPSLVDSGVALASLTPDLDMGWSPPRGTKRSQLYVLSSHEEDGISRISTAYAKYLDSKNISEIYGEDGGQLGPNMAYTLACRRSKLAWKSFLVCASQEKLSTQFHSGLAKPFRSSQAPNIAFVFSGQGAQWFGMGRELLQYEQFSNSVKEADLYMRTIGCEWSLLTELLKDEEHSIINLPRISQPLCTALQVALVDLLEYWNILPQAVVGHSSGEIAAAYALGALSREDAWKLAYHRGRLTSAIKYLAPSLNGRMMAVALSKDAAETFTESLKSGNVIVACINSPENVTVSGDECAILELEKILAVEGIFARVLKVENAYHSSHMEVIQRHYLQAIEDVQTLETSHGKVMFSSVTGQSVYSQDLGPVYWAQNLVSPVNFSGAMSSLLHVKTARPDILLELGPHSVLQAPVKQILDAENNPRLRPLYLSMIYRGKDAAATSLEAVGHLWTHGCQVNLERVNEIPSDETPRVLADLPTYPWNHTKTYWHESHLGKVHRFRKFARQDLIGAPTVESTFFEPRWRGFIRLSENPWVQDHQVQNTIIYPAAGMMSMVLEGTRQMQDDACPVKGYEISKMSIDKAMIIPSSAHGLETSLSFKRHDPESSVDRGNISRFEFTVYSKLLDAAWQKNCSGLVTIHYKPMIDKLGVVDEDSNEVDEYNNMYSAYQKTCTETIPARQLYETLESIGMKYGPLFQNIISIHKKDNISCTTVRIPDTKSRMPAKYEYPHLIHPATLDAMFQTVFVAGNEPMVPSFLESLFISADFPQVGGAELRGYSSALRRGFRDATGNVVMSDGNWDRPKLVVKNLHFMALAPASEDMAESGFLPNHHNLCAELVWKEDIATANVESLSQWLDLASFKNPDMAILDTCSGEGHLAVSVLTILGRQNGPTPRLSKYTLTDSSPENFERAKAQLENWSGYVDFKVLDLAVDLQAQGFKERSFDLVFGNTSKPSSLGALRKLLKPHGRLILIDPQDASSEINSMTESLDDKVLEDDDALKHEVQPKKLHDVLHEVGFSAIEHHLKDDTRSGAQEVKLIVPDSKTVPAIPFLSREIVLLLPVNPSAAVQNLSSRLTEALLLAGAKVTSTTLLTTETSFSGKICLALLEVDGPLVSNWTADEFHGFRSLISQAKGCLWVTKGGQMNSGNPILAPVVALFRTIRSEDPQKSLFTLDLDAQTDLSSNSTGRAVLSTFLKSFDSQERSEEMEYAECGGKIFIPRVILEEQLSARIERGGAQQAPKILPLFQEERPLQLEIGTLGKLHSLYFNDDSLSQLTLGPEDVEIRVQAVGLNPIDVKTALGQTSCDTLGSDVAGIVTKVGSPASKFKIGDRVVTIVPGAFKTVVRSKESIIQTIPSQMSFEIAASVPTDFLTAYYAIVTIGRLQEGDSILIHTGAGGFVQAAVQIAKHLGAEIFITVTGSDDRATLIQTSGVAEDHILSTTSSFSSYANRMTEGRGFELILNSFSGDTRGQALSCIREYGTFVDLDIDGNLKANASLTIPRLANVTYSAVDVSHMVKSNIKLVSGLFQSTFDLFRELFVQQSMPLKVLNFSEISTAFQEEHDGNHAVKIVLRASEDDLVPVVPRDEHPLRLDPNATYVLVGGLGGLGRSLAGLLVEHGAKNLAFFSRSGAASGQQQLFIDELGRQGIEARTYKCDICDRGQLAAAIQKCSTEMPSIRGVVQGAAVIRDAIFENMTYEDWVTATGPKIQGSWHLHELMPKDLEFFVFLSSSAGVIGARGQANYAAGNGFQDALAIYRRKQGLSAVSLDLGPILGVGMVAEDEATLDILRASGFLGVREKDFHLLVTAAMTGYTEDNHVTPAQVIIGTGTGGIIKQNQVGDPYWHSEPTFSIMRKIDLAPTSNDPSSDTISMQDLLSTSTSLQEAAAIVTEGLAILLSRSMNMLPADLDTRKPANAYGVDSLVAVGTRNWIFRETGVDVSVFEILSESSIEELAEKIARGSKYVSAEVREECADA